MLALVLGICLWSLLPLAIFFALSVLVTMLLGAIARVAFGAFVGAGPPPEEGCGAGCALALVAAGAVSVFAAVIVGSYALILAVGAAISVLIVAGLAQWADYLSDIPVVQAGQGQALIDALAKLGRAGTRAPRWASLVSTSAPADGRALRG